MMRQPRSPHLSPFLQRGSAIIEVIIAAGIVGVIATSIAVAMTTSIHNAAQARYKEEATNLAQDLIEDLRTERKFRGWPRFFYLMTDGSNNSHTSVHCIPDEGIFLIEESGGDGKFGTNSEVGACDSPDQIAAKTVVENIDMYRQLRIEAVEGSGTDPDYIQLEVKVQWQVGQGTQEIVLNHQLSEWSR